MIVLLAGFLAGIFVGLKWFGPWFKWVKPDWYRALFGVLALALLWPAVACAQIQSIDTLWRHDSTAVVDSTRTVARVDTVYTPWQVDTTWRRDSTIARIDTVFAPPPPLAGACLNEPKGLTLLADRHFTAPDAGWFSTGNFRLVPDPTAPDGDGWVGQLGYGTGNRVGSGTMASYLQPNWQGKGYKTAYVCFWTKLDPAFTFTYPGGFFGTKQSWITNGPAGGENRLFTNYYSPDPGNGNGATSPVYLGLVLQGVPSEPSFGMHYSRAVGLVQRGQWVRVEVLAQMNSVNTAADGSVTMWVNGARNVSLTGIRWSHVKGMPDLSHGAAHAYTGATEAAEWFSRKWNNTLGGGSAYCTAKDASGAYINTDAYCFSPKAQAIWIDAERVLVH